MINSFLKIKLVSIIEIFKKTISILILYFYLFQPPIIQRSTYFLFELAIFLVFLAFLPKSIGRLTKYFKSELIILIFIVLYAIFRDMFQGGEVFFFKTLSFALQSFLIPILIVSLYFPKKYEITPNRTELPNILFWIIVVGGITSCLLLFNSSINEIYTSSIVEEMNQREFGNRIFRGFGFSENLTFTFPYILGIIAGYTIYFNKSPFAHLILVPILLLSIVVNARIGLIPVLIFATLTILKLKIRNVISILFFSILIAVILPRLPLFEVLLTNEEWILSFFIDILGIFDSSLVNTETSTLNTLFGDFLIFPETLSSWLFGSGINLFTESVYFSDIGFIIQLNYGGLIFIGLLLTFILIISYRIIKRLGYFHWFTIILFTSIITLNLKGSFFVSTPGSRFLLLLYIYFIYHSTISKNHSLNYEN